MTEFVEVNGVKLAFETTGSGRPLVFIHGWSLDRHYWAPQIEALSKCARITAYDWRGMGESTGGDARYPFSLLVDDLRVMLQKLDIQRPILCGHSQGGNTALEFAVSYPDELSGLILLDNPGIHNLPSGRLSGLLLSFSFRLLGLFFSNPLKVLAPFFKIGFYSRAFRKRHPAFISQWRDQFISNSVTSLNVAYHAQARRDNVTSLLGTVEAPTLLVRGSRDIIALERGMRVYYRNIPGAQWETIEGSGHMTLSEQPRVVSRLIEEFLTWRVGASP